MQELNRKDLAKTDHYINTLKNLFIGYEKEIQLDQGHNENIIGWNLNEYNEYKKVIIDYTGNPSHADIFWVYFQFPFYVFIDDEDVNNVTEYIEEVKNFSNLQIKFKLIKHLCKKTLLGDKYGYEFFIHASHTSKPVERDFEINYNDDYHYLQDSEPSQHYVVETYEHLAEGYLVSKDLSDVLTRSLGIWKLIMRNKTIKDLRLMDRMQSIQTIHSLYR